MTASAHISGIDENDWLAFPYGKGVEAGASTKHSTQANESQNSLIAREADKNINYSVSYPARVAVAHVL